MPTKEPINTASLQQFIQQVKGADLSNQKEVRLDINTAKQVTYSLATVYPCTHPSEPEVRQA